MIVVVDTNVPVVANGKSEQASPACVLNCAKCIQEIIQSGKFVLDDDWIIIKEYENNLYSKGQGIGDKFLEWVLTNWKNPNRCELVTITPTDLNKLNFQEFPTDPRLRSFDPADRKFIAVSIAHPKHPPILQAVDSKWWKVRKILEENGVQVEFLCEADLRKL